jgi:hypothetical protein
MKSPFPGMDPYIEASGLWADFHNHVVERIFDHLAATVPEHYLVRTGERSYVVLVEEEGKESRPFILDVGVHQPGALPAPPAGGQATAVAEPATKAEAEAVSVRAFIDERFHETFVEVYATEPEERLVTCIEVLSPSNKRPGTEGWELYLRKRQALLLGAANFVEIDLLRGGQKMPMLDPMPQAPYTLLVCRQRRAPYCKVWPAHYRRALPPIPVPLAGPDPDVTLSLQPMVEAVYARARYYRSIDYGKPLAPPLGDDEQKWLADQLRARQAQA